MDHHIQETTDHHANKDSGAHEKPRHRAKGVEQVHLIFQKILGGQRIRLSDHLAHFEDWQIHRNNQTANHNT